MSYGFRHSYRRCRECRHRHAVGVGPRQVNDDEVASRVGAVEGQAVQRPGCDLLRSHLGERGCSGRACRRCGQGQTQKTECDSDDDRNRSTKPWPPDVGAANVLPIARTSDHFDPPESDRLVGPRRRSDERSASVAKEGAKNS